jgi:hypothetical protein
MRVYLWALAAGDMSKAFLNSPRSMKPLQLSSSLSNTCITAAGSVKQPRSSRYAATPLHASYTPSESVRRGSVSTGDTQRFI